MKALTLHRPWTEAILVGGKTVENRKWPLPLPMIGHPIALHGGKTYDESGAAWMRDAGLFVPPKDADSPLGVVGVAWFGEAFQITPPQEHLDWFFGPWCWPVLKVWKLPEPIACRGAQGLWNLTDRVSTELAHQSHRAGVQLVRRPWPY